MMKKWIIDFLPETPMAWILFIGTLIVMGLLLWQGCKEWTCW